MRQCLSLIMIIIPILLSSQGSKNLELVANVPTEITGNDVWGFEHSDGTEYAIMGNQLSTRIYSLEDPSNPKLVADVGGTSSTWRDIKNFGDYVYVVADSGADGLLIIDMTNPENITHSFWQPEIEVGGSIDLLRRCHNLYIGDDAYIYLAGCNISSRGVIILDISENPKLPEVVGIEDLQYAHDVYVRDDLMFASEIFIGELSIYDISDKSNPRLLGSTPTPNNFTHNAWSSSDNQVVYTTDERGESFVGAYDISDLSDIKFLDRFKPIEGVNAIPHNTHWHDNYLYTSWYTEGVIINDVTRPDNIVEVGSFDTWEGASGGFNGCWGAFPYLPSGLLLLSDRQSGLFILKPTLVRASYLEGKVVNSETGQPINGVTVFINSGDTNAEESDANGIFKTGQCNQGEFVVTINHPEYHAQDITVTLAAGEVAELNVDLVPKAIYTLSAITSEEDGGPAANTTVTLIGEEQSYTLDSGEEGFATGEIFEGEYRVLAGKWGKKQVDFCTIVISENTLLNIALESGFEDDFLFDFGWETTSNASSGEWVRGIPIGTVFQEKTSNVDFDIQDDFGESCYVTGNAGGQGGTDDVDNGTTTLTSDWFSAADLEEPAVQYYHWFFNAGGEFIPPNDSLNVFIITPVDTQLIETIKIKPLEEDEEIRSGEWILSTIDLDVTSNLEQLKIMFVAQDDENDGHLVEAGIDGFKVIDRQQVIVEETEEVALFDAFPNPVQNLVTIRNAELLCATDVRIFDVTGRLVYSDFMNTNAKVFDIEGLQAGTYFVYLEGENYKQTIKLIKI